MPASGPVTDETQRRTEDCFYHCSSNSSEQMAGPIAPIML